MDDECGHEWRNVAMTAGQLRKALEGVPDDLTVVVRALDADFVAGGIVSAKVERGCADDDFFAIDVDSEAKDPSDA